MPEGRLGSGAKDVGYDSDGFERLKMGFKRLDRGAVWENRGSVF